MKLLQKPTINGVEQSTINIVFPKINKYDKKKWNGYRVRNYIRTLEIREIHIDKTM